MSARVDAEARLIPPLAVREAGVVRCHVYFGPHELQTYTGEHALFSGSPSCVAYLVAAWRGARTPAG